jgi:hypothetical protein
MTRAGRERAVWPRGMGFLFLRRCWPAATPGNVLQIRQALIDDLVVAPAACLRVALAEGHAAAAYLFGSNESARDGFGHTVESELVAEELVALACNPYRYAAGELCDHVGPTVEHPSAVFGLALVMILWWPVEDDDCPICCYLDFDVPDFEDEMPAEPLPRDGTATSPV